MCVKRLSFNYIFLVYLVLLLVAPAADLCWAQPPRPAAKKPAEQNSSYLDRAKSEIEKKRYPSALRLLSLEIRKNPQSAEAQRLRGSVHEKLGLFKKAVADYTHYIELKPQDPKGYILRGDAKNFDQDYEGAIEDYTVAMKLAPSSVDAYLGRGLALVGMERYDDAIKDYQWVLASNPRNSDAMGNIGRACMLAGRPLEAVAYLERALEMETDSAWQAKIRQWLDELVQEPGTAVRRTRGPARQPLGRAGGALW